MSRSRSATWTPPRTSSDTRSVTVSNSRTNQPPPTRTQSVTQLRTKTVHRGTQTTTTSVSLIRRKRTKTITRLKKVRTRTWTRAAKKSRTHTRERYFTETLTRVVPKKKTHTRTLVPPPPTTAVPPTTMAPLLRTLTIQPYNDETLNIYLASLRSFRDSLNVSLAQELMNVPTPLPSNCPGFLIAPQTLVTSAAITPFLTQFVRSSTDIIRLTWTESRTCHCNPSLIAAAQTETNATAGLVVIFDAVLNVSAVQPSCFQPIPDTTTAPMNTTFAPTLAPGNTNSPNASNVTSAPGANNVTQQPSQTPQPSTATPRTPPPTLPAGEVIEFTAVLPSQGFDVEEFRQRLAAKLNTSASNIQAVVTSSATSNVSVSFVFVGVDRPLLQSITNDLTTTELAALGILSLNAAAFTNPSPAPRDESGLKRSSSLLWVGGVAALFFAGLCFGVFFFLREKARKRAAEKDAQDGLSQPMLQIHTTPQGAPTGAPLGMDVPSRGIRPEDQL